jgi:hypothetical protein
MKNLMKQIAMSLSLTMMVASLVAISPNQAQAKGKKKAGNSAKVKSHTKGFSVDIGTSEKIKSQAKRALNTQSGDDVVTINSLTGTEVKRVRRTTKRTRQ